MKPIILTKDEIDIVITFMIAGLDSNLIDPNRPITDTANELLYMFQNHTVIIDDKNAPDLESDREEYNIIYNQHLEDSGKIIKEFIEKNKLSKDTIVENNQSNK